MYIQYLTELKNTGTGGYSSHTIVRFERTVWFDSFYATSLSLLWVYWDVRVTLVIDDVKKKIS